MKRAAVPGDAEMRDVVTTLVRSGSAVPRDAPRLHVLPGAQLRLASVTVEDHIDYQQHSERHLVHATLSGATSLSAARIGGKD